MGIFGITLEECQQEMTRISKRIEEGSVDLFARAYYMYLVSLTNKYPQIEKQSLEYIVRVFKEREGNGLFLSGEYLERLKQYVHKQPLNVNKEYFKEILGTEMKQRPIAPAETKEFIELEPVFVERAETRKRGGRGQEKKQVKHERLKAKNISARQVQKLRKETHEYDKQMKRLEKEVQRQAH
ncbi:hypothetical protein NEOKW01_0495 [Nematocida sp. AWRm80]|nr:hypothetical protein NEOKW01_0495 [Nematocida sp. AWRm80]